MANTYNWDCKQLTCILHTNQKLMSFITFIGDLNGESSETHEVDGEQVPYTASVYGTQSLSLEDIGTDFIPFADLTNEIVTGWVEGIMGEEEVAGYKVCFRFKNS